MPNQRISSVLEFVEEGKVLFGGGATYWDDLTGGVGQAITVGVGVTLVAATQTLDFVATANTADYAWLPFQLAHRCKIGAPIFPHVHWEQTQANVPNWLIQYRWQVLGGVAVTAWSNYKCNTPAFTYDSGTLNQLSYGAGITPSSANISDILQIRVVRDSTNTSGVFAGADPYTATASVTAFDLHVECDSLGSASEYVK